MSSEVGLNYAYMEKVPGHRCENTRWPKCRALLVKHLGSKIKRWRLNKDMHYPDSGHTTAIKIASIQALSLIPHILIQTHSLEANRHVGNLET